MTSPAAKDDAPEGSSTIRAPFIAFEGVEGCGKSTQISLLSHFLASSTRPFLITREPGGTPLGDALRNILLSPRSSGIDGLTELFILEASRRVHVQTVILPALSRGIIVVCDRFADSSVAYQGGGRRLGAGLVEALNRRATGNLQPDVTILLDLPAEAGLSRVGRRPEPEDRLERETLAFHKRVRNAYLRLAARRGDNYRVVDASASPEQVHKLVMAHIGPMIERFQPPRRS
ncbi:dTMP kinase [Candidatus Eisenbacteria bacterium]|uniref:Thymidylate kinase n=1 Tax=Eiseniibacteriota bacterium TaxID=2212470 RepID=A0ABV6YL64_UNCEI